MINPDRMWHYTEGIDNWDPIWPRHGIRILARPLVALARRHGAAAAAAVLPGVLTNGTLQHIMGTGHEHTWFVLTQKIVEKEFALSGSEQNPDITSKSVREVLKARLAKGAPAPVEAFKRHGVDFVVENDLRALVDGMNALTEQPTPGVRAGRARGSRPRPRGSERLLEDMQMVAIRGARNYLGDKLIRVATPHRLLDPKAGPLIAVRLWVLTRKTLGGLQTDLSARVLKPDGQPLGNVYAAGEVAGFGGGGMHGYRALEGTFLGGCLFSGRSAGRAAAG